jgi:nucleoside-diphosphate-sugar epimerase
MRTFVAGGHGAVSRHLVPGLVAEGHGVVVTSPSQAQRAKIRASGADTVGMDGLNRALTRTSVRAARPVPASQPQGASVRPRGRS